MDAQLAAKIMYADEIAAAADVAATISEKAAEYASSYSQALSQQQQEDMLIQLLTRKIQESMLLQHLKCYFTKREVRPDKKHGTV